LIVGHAHRLPHRTGPASGALALQGCEAKADRRRLERGLLSKMRINTKPHVLNLSFSALHEPISASAAYPRL
jgi:hypothetical protein